MSLCYGWNCDCWQCQSNEDAPLAHAHVDVEVGEFCGMSIHGCKPFRVLVVSKPEVTMHNERRAEVVVVEENLYVQTGKLCRPLASTLYPL